MSKRKSSIARSESERLLRTIDKQVSQTTIAQRVDRLIESAAPGMDGYVPWGDLGRSVWAEVGGFEDLGAWLTYLDGLECTIEGCEGCYGEMSIRDNMNNYFDTERATRPNNRDAVLYERALGLHG